MTQAACVGPNAILQTAAALDAQGGRALTEQVFARAELEALLHDPPDAMVPQDSAAALFRAVQDTLPPQQAWHVAEDAGRRTGTYILRNRIPRPVQWGLRALPARLAGPMLLRAITRHAWTFAGDALVAADPGPPMSLHILRNPLAVPGCPWHRSVLATLFAALVTPGIHVRETSCCASGAAGCRFLFDLPVKDSR